MLTIFNRRELMGTFSIREQARVRDMLRANGIRYLVRTVNWMGESARVHTGTFGQDMDRALQYLIYVHKKDLERAASLIRRA